MAKYSLEERLEIGREIYSRHLTTYEAAEKYNINLYTARDYMRLYRDTNHLPAKNQSTESSALPLPRKQIDYDDLENMTKDELIDEVIKARVDAERAKKGYSVKGSGQAKEFISLKNQNSK